MRPGSRIETATSAELRESPLPERLLKAARIDVVDEDGKARSFIFRNVDGALDPVPRGVWRDDGWLDSDDEEP